MELRPRVIKGFSDYVIYPDGKIYSCKRHQIMKPTLNKGYYRIQLVNNKGKPISSYIHRLVAENFIDNPENKPCVDHIDRNPSNNNICNLRWVTHSENMQNKGMSKNNTTGIKNILFKKSENTWRYEKVFNGKLYTFENKNKILVICYKYIHILKIKAKLFDRKTLLFTNTSGVKYISFYESHNTWIYQKTINGERYTFQHKNKILVLCYKYIHTLKIKAKLFDKPTIQRNNTSGIKNISFSKNGWDYRKITNRKLYSFYNKNKQIVLCCKFVHSILS